MSLRSLLLLVSFASSSPHRTLHARPGGGRGAGPAPSRGRPGLPRPGKAQAGARQLQHRRSTASPAPRPWAMALLEIGRYRMEVEDDDEGAREAFEQVSREHAQSVAAPGAYYYLGLLTLNRATTPAELDDALAQFSRVETLYPGTPWVPRALQASALVHRRAGRYARGGGPQPPGLARVPGQRRRPAGPVRGRPRARPPGRAPPGHGGVPAGPEPLPREPVGRESRWRGSPPSTGSTGRPAGLRPRLGLLAARRQRPQGRAGPPGGSGPAAVGGLGEDEERGGVRRVGQDGGQPARPRIRGPCRSPPTARWCSPRRPRSASGRGTSGASTFPPEKPGEERKPVDRILAAAVTPGGAVLVSDEKNDAVYRFDADGRPRGALPRAATPEKREVTRIIVDGERAHPPPRSEGEDGPGVRRERPHRPHGGARRPAQARRRRRRRLPQRLRGRRGPGGARLQSRVASSSSRSPEPETEEGDRDRPGGVRGGARLRRRTRSAFFATAEEDGRDCANRTSNPRRPLRSSRAWRRRSAQEPAWRRPGAPGAGPARDPGRPGRPGPGRRGVRGTAAEPVDRELRRRDRPPRGREAAARPAAPRPRHAGPGLRVPGPGLLRDRPAGEGLGELPPDRPAEARPRLLAGAGLSQDRRPLQLREEVPGGLPGGLLGAAGSPGHAGRDASGIVASWAHRLLPPRGPRRRLHGRDLEGGLSDRDPAPQHRADGHRDAGGPSRARPRQRLLHHPARRRGGLDRRRAPGDDLREPGPRPLRPGPGPGARPDPCLGPGRGSRISPSEATPSSSGASATRP